MNVTCKTVIGHEGEMVDLKKNQVEISRNKKYSIWEKN